MLPLPRSLIGNLGITRQPSNADERSGINSALPPSRSVRVPGCARNDANRLGGGAFIASGAVAIITGSPVDAQHAYKVCFNDGAKAIVSHGVKKFFGLLLKKNGYVLEQLYSPLIVHTTPEHAELKAICNPR